VIAAEKAPIAYAPTPSKAFRKAMTVMSTFGGCNLNISLFF
jgi:hypothetical protein